MGKYYVIHGIKKVTFVLKYDGDTDFVAARDLLMTSCYCKKLDSKFYLYYGCNIKT